jgi:dihydroorotate dehydrogenase
MSAPSRNRVDWTRDVAEGLAAAPCSRQERRVFAVPEAAFSALLPILRHVVDAETAHGLTIRALAKGLVRVKQTRDDPLLAVRALGTVFPNPIGLAAGFDKDAVAVLPLMDLGFGFVEAGTVTRLPQTGNPKPRLFRLEQDRAVINRMGFNNAGLAAYCGHLPGLSARRCPFGANVGINKEGADPERDYPELVAAVGRFADYVTINVSSPNTPGLRDLQGEVRLRAILRAIAAEVPVRPPVLVKLAPDLADAGLQAVVHTAIEEGAAGLIISNTTISRPASLRSANGQQPGGLSGAPLFERSTEMLARAARLAQGRLVLIGCGGVRTGADALAKIKAGASLVQVYTEFAYAGPALIPRLKRELAAAVRLEGFGSVAEAVGAAL